MRDVTTEDLCDKSVRLAFPATPTAVRSGLAGVLAALPRLRLSPEDCATVELVLAEVMNNITEHAYRDRAFGRIELMLARHPGRLGCTVIDDGVPMPNLALPPGRPADLDCETQQLPEGGFGWNMIRQLTEELSYSRVGGQNILRLSVPTA